MVIHFKVYTLRFIIIHFLMLGQLLLAQDLTAFKVHSHNDYYQNVPFWRAYAAGAASIEADVFLKNGSLYVAHSTDEIQTERTLESLYIQPLLNSLGLRQVKKSPLQLLIDIKSDAHATLDAVVELLRKYPALTQDEHISFVISGNRPNLDEYANYPDFIEFDYQSLDPITEERVSRKIALVSLSFGKFSGWNGLGRLTKQDSLIVAQTIQKAHSLKKPFRFWGAPDTKTAWYTFKSMGVDFINTDAPFACYDYLKTLDDRIFKNGNIYSKVYVPTFESDRADEPVKNLILLIGDGNGLSQITAAQHANKGTLSLTQLKSIGLIKTQSADDFTTDSAAGATAMATGRKTNNRAIGVDKNGNTVTTLVELLSKKGFTTGIITTDGIAGATPSSFYAHQKDRSQTDEILKDFRKSPLNLVMAKGKSGEMGNHGFSLIQHMKELASIPLGKTGFFYDSETNDDTPEADFLAEASQYGLHHLNQNDAPFFVMIEGANIDSYGHKNSVKGIIHEGIAFDRAVGEALKFADQNQNTLVIVTADHETSGLSLPHGSNSDYSVEGDFASTDHSGTMVPLFAYGPQSQKFTGVYENSQIFHKIIEVLGIK